MTWHLQNKGHPVNEKCVRRLMRLMGLMGLMPIYQKPNTSKAAKGHKTYPYLLRGLRVARPNQVWAADITYLPMRGKLDRGEVSIRTEIEQKGGFPIPLNYELYKKDGGWKVYDISVDNISLVTNYRSSFARKIKEAGIDGLIKSLRSRNGEES